VGLAVAPAAEPLDDEGAGGAHASRSAGATSAPAARLVRSMN
jgi:hypothetical protein